MLHLGVANTEEAGHQTCLFRDGALMEDTTPSVRTAFKPAMHCTAFLRTKSSVQIPSKEFYTEVARMTGCLSCPSLNLGKALLIIAVHCTNPDDALHKQ